MKSLIIVISFTLICAHLTFAEVEPYRIIKIESIFSKLIIRNTADRVYSGQIKSKDGLIEFEGTYGITVGKSEVDFGNQMLIFGITDNISTRAFQFLKQEKIGIYTLDYAETGIEYKLRIPQKGRKHGFLQVFVLKKIEGISHIRVKNYMQNGLSKIYGKQDHKRCSEFAGICPHKPPIRKNVRISCNQQEVFRI